MMETDVTIRLEFPILSLLHTHTKSFCQGSDIIDQNTRKGFKDNEKERKGNFDGKADEGFFVRYSLNSRAFIVFNSRTRIVEENFHIRFSENTPNVVGSRPDWLFDIDALIRIMYYEPIVLEKEDNINSTNNVNTVSSTINAAGTNEDNELLFDPNMPALEDVGTFNFSNEDEDDNIVADMNNMDKTIQVSPVPSIRIHKDHPLDQVFKNKKDERGIMIRNKARLVAQGHTQEEGIDYDEVFAHVARTKATRLFLAYASFKDFVVYQMDVKSAFLHKKIKEEVYVCQPPRFEDSNIPDRVYKVKKALYGLH
uniref:Retrovirus-related Pol polyprotein from transposon TNT 1-94 n=1 Tax=Tanacetum cinerariifolium TaxID=118510 RepID=A0A699GLC2_TANCI|nr:retrovirus-related Pol polyprotein from transposon TNT 1-94 [Tanacetum cinerariifolium]